MYREILRGRTEQELLQSARQLGEQVHVNTSVLERVLKYPGNRTTVVVTASLEPVVEVVVRQLGLQVDAVYGSRPRIESGVYTGELLGGECQCAAKAQRVVAELGTQLCEQHTVAFGNLPADREMLELSTEAYVVDRGRIRPFKM